MSELDLDAYIRSFKKRLDDRDLSQVRDEKQADQTERRESSFGTRLWPKVVSDHNKPEPILSLKPSCQIFGMYSLQGSVSFCGHAEFVPSTPPKYYLLKTSTSNISTTEEIHNSSPGDLNCNSTTDLVNINATLCISEHRYDVDTTTCSSTTTDTYRYRSRNSSEQRDWSHSDGRHVRRERYIIYDGIASGSGWILTGSDHHFQTHDDDGSPAAPWNLCSQSSNGDFDVTTPVNITSPGCMLASGGLTVVSTATTRSSTRFNEVVGSATTKDTDIFEELSELEIISHRLHGKICSYTSCTPPASGCVDCGGGTGRQYTAGSPSGCIIPGTSPLAYHTTQSGRSVTGQSSEFAVLLSNLTVGASYRLTLTYLEQLISNPSVEDTFTEEYEFEATAEFEIFGDCGACQNGPMVELVNDNLGPGETLHCTGDNIVTPIRHLYQTAVTNCTIEVL